MPTQFMPLKAGSTFISPITVSLLSSVPVMMITDFNTSLIADKMELEQSRSRVAFTEYLRVPSGERHNLYTERVHNGIIDSRAKMPDAFSPKPEPSRSYDNILGKRGGKGKELKALERKEQRGTLTDEEKNTLAIMRTRIDNDPPSEYTNYYGQKKAPFDEI
jgi:hypothetical protein